MSQDNRDFTGTVAALPLNVRPVREIHLRDGLYVDQFSDGSVGVRQMTNDTPTGYVVSRAWLSADEWEMVKRELDAVPAASEQVGPASTANERHDAGGIDARNRHGTDGEILTLIHWLRSYEGESVNLVCDNPDGPPNCAVEVCGDYTGWEPRRFTGNTLVEALRNAADAKRAGVKP